MDTITEYREKIIERVSEITDIELLDLIAKLLGADEASGLEAS